jgi:hypothetical protein
MMEMSAAVKATIKDAAQKLTGHRRRAFMAKVAKVAEDYFEGSARQTETYLATEASDRCEIAVRSQSQGKWEGNLLAPPDSVRAIALMRPKLRPGRDRLLLAN